MAKGLVRTIQCTSLWGTPVKPSGKIIFLSCHCFPPLFLGPQRSPGQNFGPRRPDLTPGPKKQKDARRKMVQNPAGIHSNGARRCKLRPKNILGATLDLGVPRGSLVGTIWYLWHTFWGTWWIPFDTFGIPFLVPLGYMGGIGRGISGWEILAAGPWLGGCG